MEGRKSETALGTARARFVEGLPRKAGELKAAVALLASTPDAARPREELRRRLHALYASAQVFRLDVLADALRDGIKQLDQARDAARELSQDEIDSLASLAATLPGLVADARPAQVPSTAPPSTGRSPKSTLLGVPSRPPPAERPSRPPVRRPSGTFTAARAPSEHPPPPSVTPLETIISVLVVEDVESQARIRAALPAERFEIVAASEPEEALRLARMGAPDVVVAGRDLVTRDDVDFIRRLRSDPLTDFVPVILLLPSGTANDLIAVREEGADETLGKPFEPDQLVRAIVRVAGDVPGGDAAFDHLGDLTPEELASRLAEELRRGLVETAESGRDVRVPMGDGAEVLAAAWSAIARVRASLAQRSGGRVRFRDSARRGGPAVMALVDDDVDTTSRGETIDVPLRDRRILVADDDPAVVWFFAGLLREEGADVFEAADGRQALDEARRRRPDLIISDILMPEIDGFELCRSLARDPVLSDVPVILLSWKEDFLQRMRDLQAGASGYLRKEAGSAQILERIREVLRPRARLEAQLEAGGELRGRIEGVGMTTLLRTVAEHRPDARITARDAWNLFEVDIRGGTLVDVTRTATDGSFARGPKALPQLLGITTGRFTVTESDTQVRGTFSVPLEEVIADGTARLGAILDAVAGPGMRHTRSLRFDEDVLASFLRTSPEPIKKIVERLRGGAAPRDLLLDDAVAPHTLDSTLVDLARRGAIAAVIGDDGEDRVDEALRARLPGAEGAAARRGRPRRDSVDELDMPFSGGDEETASVPPPAASVEDSAEPLELRRPSVRPSPPAEEEEEEEALEPEDLEEATEPEPEPSHEAPEADEEEDDLLHEDEEDERALAPVAAPPEPVEPVEPAAPEPDRDTWRPRAARSEPGTLAWIFLLVVLGVLGFVGYELIEGNVDEEAAPPANAASEPEEPDPAPEAPEETPPPPPDPGDVPPQELSYGETIPGIDPAAGVAVAAGQGLLVIEAPEGGPAPEVQVGARELGRAPVRVALPQGRHELAFRRGDETMYRYIYLSAGQTRVIRAP